MSFSVNYKPFMTYLEPDDIVRLKKYSKAHKIPMTQIIREGLSARLSSDDAYTNGFNAGLLKSIKVVNAIEAAQMRFPSGLSIAELAEQEVSKHLLGKDNKPDKKSKTVSSV